MEPLKNARTAGICGRNGGAHDPVAFSCFFRTSALHPFFSKYGAKTTLTNRLQRVLSLAVLVVVLHPFRRTQRHTGGDSGDELLKRESQQPRLSPRLPPFRCFLFSVLIMI